MGHPLLRLLRGFSGYRKFLFVREFIPPAFLRNPHLMTLASTFWPRKFADVGGLGARGSLKSSRGRGFSPSVIGRRSHDAGRPWFCCMGLRDLVNPATCWGRRRRRFGLGFNVLRVNQRNCGGTANLTPTLYNSGLSGDMRAVINELIAKDDCRRSLRLDLRWAGTSC